MQFMIKLDKSDIQTVRYGKNVAIQAPAVTVIFSREALLEFMTDASRVIETAETPSPCSPPSC